MPLKFDPTTMAQLYSAGMSTEAIARHIGASSGSVVRAALRKLGVEIHPRLVWDRSKDQDLIRQYVTEKLGIHRCAKFFNVSVSLIARQVARLGVSDPSRWRSKWYSNKRQKRNERKRYNFTQSVQTKIYKRDMFLCKWCKKPTTPEDRCIHHIVPVKEAKTLGWSQAQIRDVSNGETFHSTCHLNPDIYAFIHNGWNFSRVGVKARSDLRVCNLCGSFITGVQLKSGCKRCLKEVVLKAYSVESLGVVSSKFGISKKCISTWAKEAGVHRAPLSVNGHPNYDLEKNFQDCLAFYTERGTYPRAWATDPEERKLGVWLQRVCSPSSSYYDLKVRTWRDQIKNPISFFDEGATPCQSF